MAVVRHMGSTGPGGELLERRLRQALTRRELVVHYQPRVDSVTRRVVAVEALVRWNHPELGLLGPSVFVPMAERTGLIAELGSWVLRRACADAVAWQGQGRRVAVSVNVSPRQFELQDLPGLAAAALSRAGLNPSALELEVTEGLPLSTSTGFTEALRRLGELGVVCALDDFGAGHASLSALRRHPFRIVKLDQSLVSPDIDMRQVLMVVELARSLGVRVVAEGVENERQRLLLAGAGCDEIQGHLVSAAVPASRVTRVLAQRGATGKGWPAVCPVARVLDEQSLAGELRSTAQHGSGRRRGQLQLVRAAGDVLF